MSRLRKKTTATLMLTGAAVCVAACVFLVWRITSTGDASMEWMVWVLLISGFGLFGGAYINEKMSRTLLPPMWRLWIVTRFYSE